jgi:hypothetical protein
MVSLVNRAFGDEPGVVFVFFDDKWTPIQAWTRLLGFGKVTGEILPESKPLTGPLPEMLGEKFQVPSSELGELPSKVPHEHSFNLELGTRNLELFEAGS